ncbi:uncharacterized protein [Primulina eburnea]|uniref:uncharacterized protein n=1 Tax=Primulina eburnea TaxID=1245227 RepID=UPI003C6C7BB3
MDPDEISRLAEEMRLSAPKEKDTIILDDSETRIGHERLNNCLVAKILSPKAMNRETFHHQMPRILQASRKAHIEAMGDNTFVCDFVSQRDRNRALTEGPWNFFKSLVIFKEPMGWQNPNDMVFNELGIWVQFHNLPLAFMQGKLLNKVGRHIGKVEEVDSGENGVFLGRFVRIRVRINISQPLMKFIRIKANGEEEDIIVLLVYERLPDLCYACGELGIRSRKSSSSTEKSSSIPPDSPLNDEAENHETTDRYNTESISQALVVQDILLLNWIEPI